MVDKSQGDSDLALFCTLNEVVVKSDDASPTVAGKILDAFRTFYPETLFRQLGDRRGILLRREFVLFAGSTVNAMAGRANQSHVLGFYEGLLDVLSGLAHSLLSRDDILSDIGSSHLGRTESADLVGIFKNRAFYNIRSCPIPVCPKRRKFAETLTTVMLYYVMHHEFLHSYYGHIDLFENVDNLSTILEVTSLNRLKRDIDVYRHIAELEADGGAWRSLFTRHTLSAIRRAGHDLDVAAPEWARIFFDAMFLVTGLWTVLDRGADIPTDGWKDWLEYPAGIIRARALYRSVFVDKTFLGTLSAEALTAMQEGFSRSQEDLRQIAGRVPQFEFLGRLGSADWDAPVAQYFDNVVGPHLSKFLELVAPFRLGPVQR